MDGVGKFEGWRTVRSSTQWANNEAKAWILTAWAQKLSFRSLFGVGGGTPSGRQLESNQILTRLGSQASVHT